jgi:uncharacterized 2Fe-2S/4Fe-4S cluster protein (DUF4445 family)
MGTRSSCSTALTPRTTRDHLADGRVVPLDPGSLMADVVHNGVRRPLVAGRTLFEFADDLSVVVPASCRRTGRCRECVVEVTRGAKRLSDPTEAEAFLRPPYRLACQARVERTDGDVGFSVVRRRLRILASATDLVESVPLEPAVERRGNGVWYGNERLDTYRGHMVGLALDVGTTTVVAEFLDLETGVLLASVALENPQRFGGSDVINRIDYDGGPNHGELRRALSRALNHEIRRTCAELGVDRREICDVVVAGNATMRDLFFGLDVRTIGVRPFRSLVEQEYRDGLRPDTSIVRRAHELGLLALPDAPVYGAPLIASHVGADTAADLVTIDVEAQRGPVMLIDIGTNTEIVLAHEGRYLATSAPAGPAFEGGLVGSGMAGAEGAIEWIRLRDGAFEYRTIGDVLPEGICGSGLIDLVATLREGGRMTELGRFTHGSTPIEIVPERGIAFSREDVNALVQAKSATWLAQVVLLRTLGVRPSDLASLYLAGGFATYLDYRHAVQIGLVVPVPEVRVHKVGNASVRGARIMLLSQSRRRAIERLATRIEHVELEAEPDFFDLFVDGCRFEPMVS